MEGWHKTKLIKNYISDTVPGVDQRILQLAHEQLRDP